MLGYKRVDSRNGYVGEKFLLNSDIEADRVRHWFLASFEGDYEYFDSYTEALIKYKSLLNLRDQS